MRKYIYFIAVFILSTIIVTNIHSTKPKIQSPEEILNLEGIHDLNNKNLINIFHTNKDYLIRSSIIEQLSKNIDKNVENFFYKLLQGDLYYKKISSNNYESNFKRHLAHRKSILEIEFKRIAAKSIYSNNQKLSTKILKDIVNQKEALGQACYAAADLADFNNAFGYKRLVSLLNSSDDKIYNYIQYTALFCLKHFIKYNDKDVFNPVVKSMNRAKLKYKANLNKSDLSYYNTCIFMIYKYWGDTPNGHKILEDNTKDSNKEISKWPKRHLIMKNRKDKKNK